MFLYVNVCGLFALIKFSWPTAAQTAEQGGTAGTVAVVAQLVTAVVLFSVVEQLAPRVCRISSS